MEHTLLVPPTALVHVLGVSAIRLSARRATVLDAAGTTVLTVTRDPTQPANQSFSDWLKWIRSKAIRQRMARASRRPARTGGRS
jgi:hypothetical protein